MQFAILNADFYFEDVAQTAFIAPYEGCFKEFLWNYILFFRLAQNKKKWENKKNASIFERQ